VNVKDKLQERSLLEMWFDKHNHKMEFLRTFFAFANLIVSSLIILKVFDII
tara:strand:+ start:8851 stop:9003 length:153 start_codon:yes stop_codon:yes gene_type:complete